VEGAHRSDVEMKSITEKEYTLQYKPHEPGIYLVNVKFGDDHVTGMPPYQHAQLHGRNHWVSGGGGPDFSKIWTDPNFLHSFSMNRV